MSEELRREAQLFISQGKDLAGEGVAISQLDMVIHDMVLLAFSLFPLSLVHYVLYNWFKWRARLQSIRTDVRLTLCWHKLAPKPHSLHWCGIHVHHDGQTIMTILHDPLLVMCPLFIQWNTVKYIIQVSIVFKQRQLLPEQTVALGFEQVILKSWQLHAWLCLIHSVMVFHWFWCLGLANPLYKLSLVSYGGQMMTTELVPFNWIKNRAHTSCDAESSVKYGRGDFLFPLPWDPDHTYCHPLFLMSTTHHQAKTTMSHTTRRKCCFVGGWTKPFQNSLG